MSDTTLELAVVGIALAAVGAVAAIVAAVFAYPGWRAARQRPNLRLVGQLHDASRPAGHRSVNVFLKIENTGDAPAVGWRLTLMGDGHEWAGWGKAAGRYSSEGHGRDLTLSWQAADAAETIEPGRHVRIGVALPNFDQEQVRSRYILDAVGMETRRGTLEVRWSEDQEEQEIFSRVTSYGFPR